MLWQVAGKYGMSLKGLLWCVRVFCIMEKSKGKDDTPKQPTPTDEKEEEESKNEVKPLRCTCGKVNVTSPFAKTGAGYFHVIQ